jgi:hypothetical protein
MIVIKAEIPEVLETRAFEGRALAVQSANKVHRRMIFVSI